MGRGAKPPLEARTIEEEKREGVPDRWVHPEWEGQLPWVVQGVTGRGRPDAPSDFALFREGSLDSAPALWASLAVSLGFSVVFHSRQVHGRDVLFHDGPEGYGLEIGPDADGHASGTPGVLMGVTVADCVPVYLVDPLRKAVAVLHAGWRGVVAGVLERGLQVLKDSFGSPAGDLLIHLGPAICVTCYEVGPEVHDALGLSHRGIPTPVDLLGILAARAMTAGVDPSKLTRSAHCTCCGGSPFFSHRRGDQERQVGYLGIRPR